MATKTKKMKPQVKRKWVKALRSGRYRKGTNNLRHTGKEHSEFCCLGVLCDLYQKDTGKGAWEREAGDYEYTFKATPKGESEQSILPVAVMKWAGLKECDPIVLVDDDWIGDDKIEKCLSEINDDGTKFSKIADLIQKQL